VKTGPKRGEGGAFKDVFNGQGGDPGGCDDMKGVKVG